MPIILVTAYPSIENTILALRFQIYDYLLKPIDYGVLLERVSKVLTTVSTCRDVALEVQRSIRKRRLDLDISFRNIFDTLMRLRDMTRTIVMDNDEQSVQNLHGSAKLRDSLVETVAVLKKTKGSFKSRDLGVLRAKLESLLEATF